GERGDEGGAEERNGCGGRNHGRFLHADLPSTYTPSTELARSSGSPLHSTTSASAPAARTPIRASAPRIFAASEVSARQAVARSSPSRTHIAALVRSAAGAFHGVSRPKPKGTPSFESATTARRSLRSA